MPEAPLNARPIGWWLPIALLLAACDDAPPSENQASDDAAAIYDAGARPDAEPDAGQRLLIVERGADRRGADGTSGHPFPDPQAAYRIARSGDLVFLRPGAYGQIPGPPAGVELSGSGPEATLIEGPLEIDAPGVVISALGVRGGAPAIRLGASTTLRDLIVRDAAGVGVLAEGGVQRLERLQIIGAVGAGVRLIDAESVVEGLQVSGIAYDAEGIFASSLAIAGGTATLVDVRVRGATDRGVRLAMGAIVEASGLNVEGGSTGVAVLSDAQATLRGVVVRRSSTGVAVIGAAATLQDVRAIDAGRLGLLFSEAHVEGRALWVEGSAARGIGLLRATAELAEVYVEGAGDVGIQITDPSGPIEISGGTLVANRTSGVAIDGDPNPTIELRDLTIRGTLRGEGDLGEGVHLYRGGGDLVNVQVTGSAGNGVLAQESALTWIGGRASDNGEAGVATLEPPEPTLIEAVAARGNAGAGFIVVQGEIRLSDCEASGTRRDAEDAAEGIAALVESRVIARGGRLAENAGSGLFLFRRSTAELQGVVVESNGAYGVNVGCDGSTVEISGGDLRDNAAGDRNPCP